MIAALYDVHGNIHALRAVLDEIGELGVDQVIFGGDLAIGPFPRETVDACAAVPGARYVRGNGDRVLAELALGDLDHLEQDPEGARWCVEQLSDGNISFLGSFEPVVNLDVEGLGRVCFCHATPTSDEEVVLPTTADDDLLASLAGTDAELVVCGHTHMQFERDLGHIKLVNAGSVGMPYADTPGAYWLLLGPDGAHFRRTDYDLEEAAAAIRATTWPPAEAFATENVLTVPTAKEVIEIFSTRA